MGTMTAHRFYIANGHICSLVPPTNTGYYISGDRIHGPGDSGHYISDGHIYGPRGSTGCYISDNYIHGPWQNLPFGK